ncbi:MAG TPA: glycosyltransferase [Verrucomicrobiae bacterium]
MTPEVRIPTVPVTAIIAAYQRIGQTLETLKRIEACRPIPDEIIVHVDGHQTMCGDAIRQAFPEIKVFTSSESIGPGGGRNRLISEARNEWVASFDDDSFPLDADYFGRVAALFAKYPEAAILRAAIYHQGESINPDRGSAEWVADFIGCGCAYRRSVFLKTSGYVPLTVAYGMEEVDIGLRLVANGHKILKTPWLRVYHDTRLRHHANPDIVAASIANRALLAFLRYPVSLWPVGAVQCLGRIRFLLKQGRSEGIWQGIGMIPRYIWSKRQLRRPLSCASVIAFLKLRRQPVQLESQG